MFVRFARGIAWAISAALTAWATAALAFDVRVPWLRAPSALVYLAVVVLVYLRVRPRPRAHVTAFACFLLVLAWWRSLEPWNGRDWQPDVAVLPHADSDGERVTIHDVRDCVYRSETDFDVRHHDRTFDLSKLESVDLFLVYWGSPSIAHTMVSFGFRDEGYVCVSIETRKEKGEGYSALRGFFRQYELTYVVADERDLVGLRTDFRHEDVYLYRLKVDPGVARGLFLEYMNRVDALYETPRWYNAATSNCTTNIRDHARLYSEDSRADWRFLVNGYLDRLLYERGRIDTSLPFEETRKRAFVNPLAQAASGAADFSERIRANLSEPAH